jgi:hypothetical protein
MTCTQTEWHDLGDCADRAQVIVDYQQHLAAGYVLESGKIRHTEGGTVVSNGFAPRVQS